MSNPPKRRPVFLTAACACVMLTSAVHAQSIDDAASDIAKQVKSILTDQGVQDMAVTVGTFESEFGPSTTLGLQERLRRNLLTQMVKLNGKDVGVSGKVRMNKFLIAISGYVDIQSTGQRFPIGARKAVEEQSAAAAEQATQSLRASKQIVDKYETVAAVVKRREDVVALGSPTYEADISDVDLSPRERRQALDDEFKYGVEEPGVHIDRKYGTISAFDDSKFRIEILVKDRNGDFSIRPKTTALNSGHAFVELVRGQQFAIRIHNNADFDIGARVLLDGLDAFSFSSVPEYRDKGALFYVPGRRRPSRPDAVLVKGWYIDNQNVYSFDVTTLPQGAAAELNRSTAKVGVITVQFFPAWLRGERPPVVELAQQRGATGRGLAIGRGAVAKQRFKTIPALFGQTIQASISVRYDHP